MSLYNTDFHAWAHEQAALAKSRSGNALDWDNVAEELESLGKQQRSQLKSRYEVLIVHLLKWLLQPERRSRSWELTVREQRARIADLIDENPSLRSSEAEVFGRAYALARAPTAKVLRRSLEAIPLQPPFTAEQARDEAFWPEAEA